MNRLLSNKSIIIGTHDDHLLGIGSILGKGVGRECWSVHAAIHLSAIRLVAMFDVGC